MQYFQAFAQTFSRNLTLTYDLSKRTVFYKVADKRLEKIMCAVQQTEPPFTPAQVKKPPGKTDPEYKMSFSCFVPSIELF